MTLLVSRGGLRISLREKQAKKKGAQLNSYSLQNTELVASAWPEIS